MLFSMIGCNVIEDVLTHYVQQLVYIYWVIGYAAKESASVYRKITFEAYIVPIL